MTTSAVGAYEAAREGLDGACDVGRAGVGAWRIEPGKGLDEGAQARFYGLDSAARAFDEQAESAVLVVEVVELHAGGCEARHPVRRLHGSIRPPRVGAPGEAERSPFGPGRVSRRGGRKLMGDGLFAEIRASMPGDPRRLFARLADGREVSYGDVLEMSARYANALAACGVGPGERVAVQVEKTIECLMVYLAALRLGAAYLPLNTAYTGMEVGYFLADAEPALFVCDPERESDGRALAKNIGVGRVETLDAQGRGIAFQVRARSIGVGFHRDWLELRLWLKGDASHPLLRKVEDFGPLGRGYHFTLRRPADLDAKLRALLRRAYAVGAQDVATRGRVKRISVP